MEIGKKAFTTAPQIRVWNIVKDPWWLDPVNGVYTYLPSPRVR
jgi:hypothetical protein